MKLQNTIKFAFLLLFAFSLTNCEDKACKKELEATKQKLADIESALDAEPKDLQSVAEFDFCTTSEAISSGSYDTRTGIAHIVIPIPVDNAFVSKKFDRKSNTVSYVFKGENYGPDTKNYTGGPVTLTGLSRVKGAKLTVEVTFQYTKDNCTTLPMTDKVKKSGVNGAP